MDEPHTFNLGAYGPNARININSVDNSTNIVQAVYIRDEMGIRLADLTYTDFRVLELVCGHMGELIERFGYPILPQPVRSISDKAEALGIDGEELQESLQILVARGYLHHSRNLSGKVLDFSPTTLGWETYHRSRTDSYDAVIRTVAEALVSRSAGDLSERTAKAIQVETGLPCIEVQNSLELLEQRGYVRLTRTIASTAGGGNTFITVLGPELKRSLRG